MKKIILLLVALQTLIFADFKDVNTAEMEALVAKNAPIIDIRTPGEWRETGVIPGSHKIVFFDERGNYDVQKFMSEFTKVVTDKNQPFILVCRTASRTKIVGKFLANDMGYTQTKELEGGIIWGWLNLKKPVTK